MPGFTKVNNERSEAIELIKFMDSIVKKNTWSIKSIGGESTLNTGDERMFPDIIVFGDLARTQILQSWEVKMPDVPITDAALIMDAQRKAEVLRLNSCLIWNFSYGVLYQKRDEGWHILREWNQTSFIRKRSDVEYYKAEWESLVQTILTDLNDFFLSGELHPARIGDIVTDTVFVEFITRNKGITAEQLRRMATKRTTIHAYISQWWRGVRKEYQFDETDPYQAYAKYLLMNWMNKFTFAHLIKRNHSPAGIIETIDDDDSPASALIAFSEITEKCDFHHVFEAVMYGESIPVSTWEDLVDYNAFLTENGIDQISQSALRATLENCVNQFQRSVSGVYTTPQRMAEILVKAGIIDLTAPAIDPCCGTGTIAREILALKGSAIAKQTAYQTTFASDKLSFAMQISGISMADSSVMDVPILLFCSNAFDLHEGMEIEILDPSSGKKQKHKTPKYGSLIANLPFVAFDQKGNEDKKYIEITRRRIQSETGIRLSRRLDLYQAILLHIHALLDDQGSIAVITSNSWLGTLAGLDFYHALSHYYTLENVVASGSGKWFRNADVVALMLFMKKKSIVKDADEDGGVEFGLLRKPIDEISDDEVDTIVHSIQLQTSVAPEILSFRHYENRQIEDLLNMNIVLNAFFYDVEWLRSVKDVLCPVTEYFDVFRGMKTGQDEIFYLQSREDIEEEYIGRVLKNTKTLQRLVAQPNAYAFVCDQPLDEIAAKGHKKTLAWIDRYRWILNQSVPNKDSFWRNIGSGLLSGGQRIRLFTGMNPEQRIFYGLLDEPTLINQRVIGYHPLHEDVNLSLCHALLNTIIGVFYAEATGFNKGLGALDNRAENAKKVLMLDPAYLSDDEGNRILQAFEPLLNRDIMTTKEEYQQEDRLAFEQIVADIYGYSKILPRILDCVAEMQKVRLSVRR
ncbi:MAG: hypothetical protein FWF83_02820 [Clostridiales bacterium]|nr:hypothetical protein [Clostridiales bacterium]